MEKDVIIIIIKSTPLTIRVKEDIAKTVVTRLVTIATPMDSVQNYVE
jgi:hypothetical protein